MSRRFLALSSWLTPGLKRSRPPVKTSAMLFFFAILMLLTISALIYSNSDSLLAQAYDNTDNINVDFRPKDINVDFRPEDMSDADNINVDFRPEDMSDAIHCQARAERRRLVADEKIAVVVPGVGSSARATILVNSLKRIPSRIFPTTVFLYKQESETLLRALTSACLPNCEVLHNLNQSWVGHLKAARLERSTEYVFVLLDDVVIQRCAVDALMVVMLRNNASVVSPAMTAPRNSMFGYHEVMKARKPVNGSVGRQVDFIEFQATLFTRRAFRCFQRIINLETNQEGWGYDYHYKCLCSPRMGIVDSVLAVHETRAGTTDSDKTNNEEQWFAWEKIYGCRMRARRTELGKLF